MPIGDLVEDLRLLLLLSHRLIRTRFTLLFQLCSLGDSCLCGLHLLLLCRLQLRDGLLCEAAAAAAAAAVAAFVQGATALLGAPFALGLRPPSPGRASSGGAVTPSGPPLWLLPSGGLPPLSGPPSLLGASGPSPSAVA